MLIPVGIFTVLSAEHFENAYCPIEVMLFGSDTLTSEVQPVNAFAEMVVTPLLIVTFTALLAENALGPMVVTLHASPSASCSVAGTTIFSAVLSHLVIVTLLSESMV